MAGRVQQAVDSGGVEVGRNPGVVFEGVGEDDATFSVPEIGDLRSRLKTLSSFGDFSTIDFTLLGLGQPRVVKAGVDSRCTLTEMYRYGKLS